MWRCRCKDPLLNWRERLESLWLLVEWLSAIPFARRLNWITALRPDIVFTNDQNWIVFHGGQSSRWQSVLSQLSMVDRSNGIIHFYSLLIDIYSTSATIYTLILFLVRIWNANYKNNLQILTDTTLSKANTSCYLRFNFWKFLHKSQLAGNSIQIIFWWEDYCYIKVTIKCILL